MQETLSRVAAWAACCRPDATGGWGKFPGIPGSWRELAGLPFPAEIARGLPLESATSHPTAKAGLDVADGSIYPALARLRKRELVTVERRSGGGGPARTYYMPSEAGMRMLRSWSRDRGEFATSIHTIIGPPAREGS
ncbi:PadR family transcriptional regulator [Streptomyces sioyaensis]|uniref:PadR family transcriptional regulator n=1 Tax=Streptomyces sioyaensis TaxID=67364 RepID=UPI0037B4C6B5